MAVTTTKQNWGFFAYQPIIYAAILGKHEKMLLSFYAWAYNWTENSPSFYSQESIVTAIPIGNDTYQKARENLERLGWIRTQKKKLAGHDYPSILVTIHIGRDEPIAFAKKGGRQPADLEAYENLKLVFAKAHPDLVRQPKFKKQYFEVQSQSIKIQKELLNEKKAVTNKEDQ